MEASDIIHASRQWIQWVELLAKVGPTVTSWPTETVWPVFILIFGLTNSYHAMYLQTSLSACENVCMCVRACVRACGCVCVFVCVYVLDIVCQSFWISSRTTLKTCVLNILLMLARVVSTIMTSPVNLGTFCVTCVVRNCTRLRHRNRQPRRQRTTVLRVYVAIFEKL